MAPRGMIVVLFLGSYCVGVSSAADWKDLRDKYDKYARPKPPDPTEHPGSVPPGGEEPRKADARIPADLKEVGERIRSLG